MERGAVRAATRGGAATAGDGGRPHHAPSWARLALALLLLALSLPAAAWVHAVDPGEVPTLAPDEGLLLVAADSNVDLASLRVKKDGALFTAGVLRGLHAGQAAQLYVVPAGRYAWHDVTSSWLAHYEFGDKPQYRFEVAPGRITYAGDLVVRFTGWYRANLLVSNRGLRAIDWLEANHPALLRAYEFQFAGRYPDPFPAFYRKERALSSASAKDLAAVDAPPPPGPLPMAIHDLWRPDAIDWVSLNPAGDLMVEALRLDHGWALDLVEMATHQARRLATSPAPFVDARWASDHLLLAGVGEEDGRQVVTLFRIGDEPGGTERTIITQRIPASGHVLATAYGVPNQILFESYMEDGRVLVHPLDIGSRDPIKDFRPLVRGRLNVGVERDLAWFADGRGRLRAAVARAGKGDDERVVLMWGGAGAGFQPVFEFKVDAGFRPQALSYEGDLIYGVTDEGRAQRELVEFDPVQRKVTRTLFAKPGVDVIAPVLDAQRRPVGAFYVEGGRVVTEYFDEGRKQVQALVGQAFPGRTVTAAGRSRDGHQWIMWVQGSDQPPALYQVDTQRGQAALLDVAAPWLEGKQFAPSTLVHATSADGMPIEAYLTLPPGQARRPLVVLPHGGPIGVSDHMLFDPQVQFLASLGYAVLQVNFRGSAGYGKAFREAGYRQWGTGIEDDIDAALQVALSRYPLDPRRMCIMGGSYGGYSALEATVRWPKRYRCAISIAGVSDRLLDFTASDTSANAKSLELVIRMFGDPDRDLDQMLATSPLYHYRDIQVPLMLVHGQEDVRVDYEHSRRLVRMLNLAGHRPVMLTFEKEAHGLDDADDIEKTYQGIAGFLARHLAPDAAPRAVAPAEGAPQAGQAARTLAP